MPLTSSNNLSCSSVNGFLTRRRFLADAFFVALVLARTGLARTDLVATDATALDNFAPSTTYWFLLVIQMYLPFGVMHGKYHKRNGEDYIGHFIYVRIIGNPHKQRIVLGFARHQLAHSANIPTIFNNPQSDRGWDSIWQNASQASQGPKRHCSCI